MEAKERATKEGRRKAETKNTREHQFWMRNRRILNNKKRQRKRRKKRKPQKERV